MKIAVVGANGQVGREVCLFLSVMGVQVIPVSRTQLGGVFLERCALACRYGAVGNPKEAGRLLEDCNLVVDFSHPHGLPSQVRPAVKANIQNILRLAPPGCPYIYISSISAFGMRDADSKLKNYFLPHLRYAADKRYLERLALSGQGKRDVYVLRLGQVHGDLQAVSQEFMEEIASGRVYLPFAADTDSYTVFCFTLAEAIINIAQGKEQPGLYTMVSVPAWSWGEVYEYWASQRKLELKLATAKRQDHPDSILKILPEFGRALAAPVLRFGIEHRELLMNYLLITPKIQERMQAEYLRRKAAAEIAQGQVMPESRRKFWTGPVPGKKLKSLSDSRRSMYEATEQVRKIVSAVTAFDK